MNGHWDRSNQISRRQPAGCAWAELEHFDTEFVPHDHVALKVETQPPDPALFLLRNHQVAMFYGVKIGAADAARHHPPEQLTGTRLRRRYLVDHHLTGT